MHMPCGVLFSMTETLDRTVIDACPFDELDSIFPDKVWILHHLESNRYGAFIVKDIHGLACFSREGGAIRFAELIELTGMVTEEVTFDEARDIAKSRPKITALMLLDNREDPQIHFVK